jgi:putative protein-disulfide isomerase
VEARMTGPNLIYIADPMCSWCWGFSPVIGAIRARFGPALPIRLVMGGLRPGTTKPMHEDAKRTTREHWEDVREASGQPFDFGFFEREGFVYDTEPPARALVVARHSGMDLALDLLNDLHYAFYAENRDVTDEAILADIAVARGLERAAFLEALRSSEARDEVWQDFATSQQAGIRGFPSLLAGPVEGAEYSIVTLGYQPAERILPPLERWMEVVGRTGDGGVALRPSPPDAARG